MSILFTPRPQPSPIAPPRQTSSLTTRCSLVEYEYDSALVSRLCAGCKTVMLAQRLLSDQIYSARTLTWVNVSRLDGPVGNARTSSDNLSDRLGFSLAHCHARWRPWVSQEHARSSDLTRARDVSPSGTWTTMTSPGWSTSRSWNISSRISPAEGCLTPITAGRK